MKALLFVTAMLLTVAAHAQLASSGAQLGVAYLASDGLYVKISSVSITETAATYRYTISYSLENRTTGTTIDEGTFKAFFQTTGGTPQYGFFDRVFPGQTVTRSYAWEETKSTPFYVIAYGGGGEGLSSLFFAATPPSGSIKWFLSFPGLVVSPPSFVSQPASQAVAIGASAGFSASASGDPSFQWLRNGTSVSTAFSLTIDPVSSQDAGIYNAIISNAAGSTTSRAVILGVTTPAKVAGYGYEIAANVIHPNGNIFDQVLLLGPSTSITSDPQQATRVSFVDLTDDIVQVEYSGPGTVSIVLDNFTSPLPPAKYNQQGVTYAKGHASIVVAGATEESNLSVFCVGRATAFDPTGRYNILLPISATNDPALNGNPLFDGHTTTVYDGVADIAFIAISSANGKFGGVRTANASYFAVKGYTGLYAPNIQFTGPVFIRDIAASGSATPSITTGAVSDIRITGGDLLQSNTRAVQVAGINQLRFVAGSDAGGRVTAAQTNRGRLENAAGVDVTTSVVVNP